MLSQVGKLIMVILPREVSPEETEKRKSNLPWILLNSFHNVSFWYAFTASHGTFTAMALSTSSKVVLCIVGGTNACMVSFCISVHPSNAYCPMTVTEFGMLMESRFVQFEKA